ncbi:hypothetical protein ABFS83_09G004800 [Erythranthe nasuta]
MCKMSRMSCRFTHVDDMDAKWIIAVYPDGTSHDKTLGGDKYEQGHVYFDLFLSPMSTDCDGVSFCVKMTLLDQSGNGIHRTEFDDVPRVISKESRRGFVCFIDREVLEKSFYLKDDCLKIECTVYVVLTSSSSSSSSSDIIDDVSKRDFDDDYGGVGGDFLAVFSSAVEDSDVVFSIGGEKFHAHKDILSARSSVFESMFAVSDQREMVITDVEPRVFKALLHFIYSDTLPENERRSLVGGYAFGPVVSNTIGAKLLAAADKYDVKRLKIICESHLWKSISLSRFAEILSLAVNYNATELKHLCFKYAADNYDVLVKLDSFGLLEKKWPSMMNEVNEYLSKQELRG